MKLIQRTVFCILCIVTVPATAFEWQDLWLNDNQQALKKLESQPDQAAEQFDDPEWRGVSEYRAGNFDEAARQFGDNAGPEARYNQGNATARAGRLDDALKLYDDLLKQEALNSTLRENTQFNRDLVKQLLDQQQNSQQSEGGENGKQGDDNPSQDSGQQNQQSQPSDNQQGQDQQGSGESAEENSSTSQSNDISKEDSGSDSSSDNEKSAETALEKEDHDQSGQSKNKTDLSAADFQDQEPLSEDEQATEQWLRNIPDDPSGLLRRKLNQTHRNEYPQVGNGGQPW